MGDLFIDTKEMNFCPVLTLENRREERKQGEEREEAGKRRQSWSEDKERGKREKERGEERMGRGEKREESAGNSSLFLLEGHTSHGKRAPLWSYLA